MSTTLQTRRARVEAREEAIIAVARELFNSKGFAKTTMAEIARDAGVADGTVYLYFKNKEALARTVLELFYAELTHSAQACVDAQESAEDKLLFFAKHHLERVTDNWRLLEMLPLMDLRVDSYEGSTLHTLNKTYVAVFDRFAQDAQRQGVMRSDLVPWILRDIFFGAMEHGARSMAYSKGFEHLERVAQNLVALLCVQAEPNDPVSNRLESVVDRLEAALERMT